MPNNSDEREIIENLLESAESAIALGTLPKAAVIYRGILAIDPDHVTALRQLGSLAIEFGDHTAGISLLRHALTHDPKDPDLYHGIGTGLRLMGQLDDALTAWQGALRVDPHYAPALYDSGLLLQQRGDLERAGDMFRRLAVAHGDHFDAVFNRAIVLYRQDNLLAAERWFHQAARLRPNDPRPFVNLAMIYRVWNIVPQAIACLEHAITLDPEMPDAHWNLANALLLSGAFERGWAEYEWRFRRPGTGDRTVDLPRWRGEDIGGQTLFVAAEQGVGDIIQFIRFIRPIAERGARVIVECPPGLGSVIATAAGVAATTRLNVVPPEARWTIPLLSIPHVLGVAPAAIGTDGRYLSVPPGTQAPRLTDAGYKVGLVWRGNPRHDNDQHRSLALETLAPLRAVAGVSWYSLQVGAGQDEVRSGDWAGHIHDLSSHFSDFAATAAIIDQLDLVISVDTAVAHLAGSLGKPVWTLISRGNDWRWGIDRQDTDWYPTMRLFRQRHPRNWAPAIAEMAEALKTAVAVRT